MRDVETLTYFVDHMAAFVDKARTEKSRQQRLATLAREKHNLHLGEVYHSEVKLIKEASGIRAADARIEAAKKQIRRLSEAIMAIPPLPIACLTIKAEAVEVCFETCQGVEGGKYLRPIEYPFIGKSEPGKRRSSIFFHRPALQLLRQILPEFDRLQGLQFVQVEAILTCQI